MRNTFASDVGCLGKLCEVQRRKKNTRELTAATTTPSTKKEATNEPLGAKRSIAVLIPSELGSRVIGGVRVGGQRQSNVSVEHGAMTKNNVARIIQPCSSINV